MSPMTEDKRTYGAATVWSAEGARVGLVTCLDCGAAVLIDSRDGIDPLNLHEAWHRHLTASVQK